MLFAIKVIKKATIRKEKLLEQLTRELKIQMFVNHVHIVKLFSFFHDSENIYLII